MPEGKQDNGAVPMFPSSHVLYVLHCMLRAAAVLAPTAVVCFVGCASQREPMPLVEDELHALFEEDQNVRKAILDRRGGWNPTEEEASRLLRTDEARRDRVHALDAAGAIQTSASKYYAAMILQHSQSGEDYRRAHELAQAAAHDGEGRARWLAAAALDRYLMSRGLPQKYGTQFRTIDGVWVLHEVDPTITDEERAEWDCPPLEQARRRAVEMNRRRPETP